MINWSKIMMLYIITHSVSLYGLSSSKVLNNIEDNTTLKFNCIEKNKDSITCIIVQNEFMSAGDERIRFTQFLEKMINSDKTKFKKIFELACANDKINNIKKLKSRTNNASLKIFSNKFQKFCKTNLKYPKNKEKLSSLYKKHFIGSGICRVKTTILSKNRTFKKLDESTYTDRFDGACYNFSSVLKIQPKSDNKEEGNLKIVSFSESKLKISDKGLCKQKEKQSLKEWEFNGRFPLSNKCHLISFE